MTASLKPWREVAVPHEDVLRGTFQQAEFAADLSRVHDGRATAEYQDPVLFFQRTFITEGMRLLLDSVVRRLTGAGGDPVVQLQTAFGGGKTHTMLAVYHLARGAAPTSELRGVPPILDAAGVTGLPPARIAVLDGNKLAPNQPQKRGKLSVRTMWGDLAWQLGGDAGYARVREADESGTSPGKEVLADLLAAHAPCVVLIDELVAYVRQFEEGKALAGGSYDSNLSFIQALTEALKAVPNAVLLASLPESDVEAGSDRGVKALRTLEHYFGRVQALWKPVATEEAFEIVRRRLFEPIADTAACEAVCRGFADFYTAHAGDLPHETQEARYYERLVNAYPMHPELFDRLYEDWSSLENFQRTRGVLKMMAKTIHRLWKDGNNDLLIMPGSVPLYDADVRNEIIYYLPQGWDPVVERDVDGERAETTELENKDTRFGAVQACRRVARTIFFGSAPHSVNMGSKTARGVSNGRVLLGVVQPGQQPGVYRDALSRLQDLLHYMNTNNDRYWFDTRPNLRREMEDRKRRFRDKDDVLPVIRDRVRKAIAPGLFQGVHVFTPSADVPDDGHLRLVVLPPEAPYTKSGATNWQAAAGEILTRRGEQPRQRQNRLLFIAADADVLQRLRDTVRTWLAWESIVEDIKGMKLNLDQYQSRQAGKSLGETDEVLRHMVRETFKWLLSPMQEAAPGKGVGELKWEAFQVNPGSMNMGDEIARVLRDNELLITEWAPIHLERLLRTWFWRGDAKEVGAAEVWQKTMNYLYLPRLHNEKVYRDTLARGAHRREHFAFAYAKEDGKYAGFDFGSGVPPSLDGCLLLIEPETAAAYEAAQIAAAAGTVTGATEPAAAATAAPAGTPATAAVTPGRGATEPGSPGHRGPAMRRFYGSSEIDPVRAKMQFVNLVDEVLMHFTAHQGTSVRVTVQIEVDNPEGFDEATQRTVKENCNVLRFKNAAFEQGE